MGTVNFAIAGCGSIAQKHAAAIKKVSSARLTAVFDPDLSKARAFADQFAVNWKGDYASLLEEKTVDVIDICAPSFLHAPMALEAFAAGKHVLVEKPMALTLADADKMIAASKDAGRQLGVVLQNRFKPAVTALKKAIEAGCFGKLSHGSATVRWNRGRDYYRQNPWRARHEGGGGVLINQAVHNIDLLCWLMGPAESVFACTAHRFLDIQVEDVAAAVLTFRNGALGLIEAASTVYPVNLEESINIFGEKGTVIIGGTRAEEIKKWIFADPKVPAPGETEETRGHIPCIEDMVRSVEQGVSPLIDGREGRKSLEIVQAIFQSAEKRGPVILPLTEERV